MRSLGPKIRAFIRDFKNRQISLALVAETWAKEDTKSYQRAVMSMFQMEGLKTLSASRRTQTGGGVAIIADS